MIKSNAILACLLTACGGATTEVGGDGGPGLSESDDRVTALQERHNAAHWAASRARSRRRSLHGLHQRPARPCDRIRRHKSPCARAAWARHRASTWTGAPALRRSASVDRGGRNCAFCARVRSSPHLRFLVGVRVATRTSETRRSSKRRGRRMQRAARRSRKGHAGGNITRTTSAK